MCVCKYVCACMHVCVPSSAVRSSVRSCTRKGLSSFPRRITWMVMGLSLSSASIMSVSKDTNVGTSVTEKNECTRIRSN